MRNAYNNFNWKTKRGRTRRRWENNTTTDLKETVEKGVKCIDLVHVTTKGGLCELGNENYDPWKLSS
jgi:hypothetical protein